MTRRQSFTAGITAVVILTTVVLPGIVLKSAPLEGEGFNVLLISLDTTRADHLGCYGHPTVKTPNIDRLAREGVAFLNCTAAAPVTLPSHASIFTGTYPFVHGVRDNGSFTLDYDNVTVTDLLSEAGYTTAGFVAAAVLNRQFGISQGFDVYGDMVSVAQMDRSAGKRRTSRRAEEVIDQAVAWLRANATEKFFLFVHLFDPHHPYEAPEPFGTTYADPYVAEIAYTDAQIGRLLKALVETGLDRQTLVVLTADHGEGRGDHDEETHGCFVYDTTVSVPLILRCPERIPGNRRITFQTRNIDIAPTILSFVGLPTPPVVQGISLLPLIRAEADDPELPAYAESMFARYNYGFSHLLSLRTGDWKYIHAPTAELYHVRVDPMERHNLALSQPERVAFFREQLRGLLENSPVPVGPEEARVELTPRAVEALRSLGYVGGDDTGAGVTRGERTALLNLSGLDPKDHTEEIRLTGQALHLVETREFPAAEQILRELIERFPERQERFSWAHNQLARVLVAQGKHYEEAIASYRKVLEIQPNDSKTLTNLGATLADNGEIEEAVQAYWMALRVEPDLAEAHFNLALALRSLGRHDEAESHLRRAVDLAPEKYRGYTDAG